MDAVSITGMVLSAMPIGDYDKRLVILTKERGRITAFAKGARRQNSALLACSQPFSFGEFFVYESRSSFRIVSVNIQNYFAELREDISSVYYGLYFCELADYLTQENMDGTLILKLLYQSFRALIKKSIDPRLIRYIFELKIIALNGEAPQVFECISCGSTEDLEWFSPTAPGTLCTQCRKHASDARKVKSSTIYTMQYILATDVVKLFSFTVTNEVLWELSKCIDQYRKLTIEKEMKSLELLDILT